MTPAIKYLEKHGISFELLSYEHCANAVCFGVDVTTKLNLPPAQVYKTLIVALSNAQLVTAMVPVSNSLNMKAIAQCMKVKSAKMAMPEQVKASTAYVLGGVSPFGQKKQLPTVVDKSAYEFDRIYVSAGKRGLELIISPQSLEQCLQARFLAISIKK